MEVPSEIVSRVPSAIFPVGKASGTHAALRTSQPLVLLIRWPGLACDDANRGSGSAPSYLS